MHAIACASATPLQRPPRRRCRRSRPLASTAPCARPPARAQVFTRRRNAQLLRSDFSWHVFWLAFGLAGFGKWFSRGGCPPLHEAVTLLLYTGWSPLIMFLVRRR